MSEIKKFGIDIDGVLADFSMGFCQILRQYLKIPIPLDFEPRDWGWSDANLPDGTMDKAWEIMDATPNFWESLPPMRDIHAMTAFFHLHAEVDHEIYFITSRASALGRSVRKQTENWLRQHLDNPRQTINVIPVKNAMDKVDVLHAMHIDASVDDYTPTIVNAKSLRNVGHRAYLIERPWNSDAKAYSVKTVSSLEEFFLTEDGI